MACLSETCERGVRRFEFIGRAAKNPAVHECPAIKHLRASGREIGREYCQHCYFLGAARAEAAGLTMRLSGGNGSCRHTFARPSAHLPPQVMPDIAEARL